MSLLNVTAAAVRTGRPGVPAPPAQGPRTALRLQQTNRLYCGAFASVYQRMYIHCMLRLRIDPDAPTAGDLEAGRVVHFTAEAWSHIPTETFYGLAADPRSPDAVKKIFSLKRRPSDRSVASDRRQHRASRRPRRLDDAARRTAGLAWLARSAYAHHSCIAALVRRRASFYRQGGCARSQ